MKKLVMTMVMVLWAGLAFAQGHQHNHGKGPNGGKMQDVAGVHAELVVSENKLTIYVFSEEMKALATKGYAGSLLLVTGGTRETVQLAPSGETALKGEAKNRIGPDTAITLVLKTAEGKSGQVKF
jgi:hypothetical protein